MGSKPEVDLDPDALRAVAAELGDAASAVRMPGGASEPVPVTAAHFGRPDADGRLAAGLADRCDEVVAALAGAAQLASALAGQLRARADTVVGADERGAAALRTAEG